MTDKERMARLKKAQQLIKTARSINGVDCLVTRVEDPNRSDWDVISIACVRQDSITNGIAAITASGARR
jgi:hypothetical protein